MKTVAPNSADFIQSILYSLGGEPVTRGPAGDVWHYGPREITFDPTGKIASAKLPNVGMGSYAFPALGLAAVGYTFLEGLSTGGLIQGVRNVALDVAVSGAVSKYAHSVHNGEFYYGKIGKGFNPLTETRAAKALRIGGYFGRFTAGTIAGYSVANLTSSIVGGPIGGVLGFGLGSLAANMAVKMSPLKFGAGLAGLGLAFGAGKLMYNATSSVLSAGYQHAQAMKQVNTAGSLAAFSTQGAYTMRARAVQAIQNSHLNTRSALGMEASFMHMPSRNYMSPYRMAV